MSAKPFNITKLADLLFHPTDLTLLVEITTIFFHTKKF